MVDSKEEDELDSFLRRYFQPKIILFLILAPFGCFFYLFLYYPVAAVVVGAVGFVLGAGLFITRFVLGMQGGWKSWLLVFVTGSAVLFFFWVVFKLCGEGSRGKETIREGVVINLIDNSIRSIS
jgi:hypothetical protein